MWVVREYSPHGVEHVFESVPFDDHDAAVMYADAVARALATLYGNPNASPILKKESETCWLVNMDYPHSADGNYNSIKVEQYSGEV